MGDQVTNGGEIGDQNQEQAGERTSEGSPGTEQRGGVDHEGAEDRDESPEAHRARLSPLRTPPKGDRQRGAERDLDECGNKNRTHHPLLRDQ